jgi:hypothetical protein
MIVSKSIAEVGHEPEKLDRSGRPRGGYSVAEGVQVWVGIERPSKHVQRDVVSAGPGG